MLRCQSQRREATRAVDCPMRGEMAELEAEKLQKRLDQVNAQIAERLKQILAMEAQAR
jgi:hypothetical protein